MMKNHFWIIALAILPLSLSAQTKSAVRRPVASTSRSAATRSNNGVHTGTLTEKKTATAPKPAPTPATSETPALVAVQPTLSESVRTASTQPMTRQHETTAPARPTYTRQSNFHVGLRFGGNSGTIGGADPASVGQGVQLARVMGFHGGLVFNMGGPTFSVQPEVLFSQYGVRFALGSDYLQLKYNMVEVPVLLKVAFGQPKLRFFVNAGPVGTYVVSGTISVREGGQSEAQAIDMSGEGRFFYGVAGGAGVAIQAGTGKVLLEGRYNYLMADHEDGSTTKPQNAMLSVGYLFPLGGR
ncbi:porin family protein [Spirosoma panaciterrae]|uniref:porin family protein n=1 Tax=Spirosoma panaciterrae TaxID=496058 RepID=UPI00035E2CDD|nr:porin family protein [Spirosoma panaciterrae]